MGKAKWGNLLSSLIMYKIGSKGSVISHTTQSAWNQKKSSREMSRSRSCGYLIPKPKQAIALSIQLQQITSAFASRTTSCEKVEDAAPDDDDDPSPAVSCRPQLEVENGNRVH